MIDYIDNYKALCANIVFEQCIDYYDKYKRFLKSPNRDKDWYRNRVLKMRDDLINGWAQYLKIDIESVVRIIESKAETGEEIIWKKRGILSRDSLRNG